MSFRTRVTALVALAVAGAFLLASLAMFASTRRSLLSAVDAQLVEAVGGRSAQGAAVPPALAALRDLIEDRRSGGRFGPGRDRPDQLRGPAGDALRGVGLVQLVNRQGDVLTTVPAGGDELPVTDEVTAVAGLRLASEVHTVRTDDSSYRVIAAGIGDGLAVQVARPIDDIEEGLRGLAVRLGLVSLLGIGLAALAGRLIADRVLVPVRRLTDTAETIARTQDLVHRAEVSGDDELARLATSLNGMLVALDASRRSQQQLVADASHELRTPLTSLRTNVEMLAGDHDLSAADRASMRDDLVGQIEEMTLLIGNLVDLAREGSEVLATVEVRLDEVVEEVAERQRRLHPDATIEVEAVEVLVHGDPDRLARAVTNLVDNAVKYAGEAGPVEVVVDARGVRVRDHGPGVATADRDRVFARFWRAARDRGAPGSGLGLAIVSQVAASHGGTASVEDAPGGGAVFHLALPTHPRQA